MALSTIQMRRGAFTVGVRAWLVLNVMRKGFTEARRGGNGAVGMAQARHQRLQCPHKRWPFLWRELIERVLKLRTPQGVQSSADSLRFRCRHDQYAPPVRGVSAANEVPSLHQPIDKLRRGGHRDTKRARDLPDRHLLVLPEMQEHLDLRWRQPVGLTKLGDRRIERCPDHRQQLQTGVDQRFVFTSVS